MRGRNTRTAGYRVFLFYFNCEERHRNLCLVCRRDDDLYLACRDRCVHATSCRLSNVVTVKNELPYAIKQKIFISSVGATCGRPPWNKSYFFPYIRTTTWQACKFSSKTLWSPLHSIIMHGGDRRCGRSKPLPYRIFYTSNCGCT